MDTSTESESESFGETETTTGGDPTGMPTSPSTSANPTTPTTVDPSTTTAMPMDGPPQLLDVRLIDARTLELYFSEAMAPPTNVDPGLFRLSLAYSNYYTDYYDWGGTFYQDLKFFTGQEYCYEYCWCKWYEYYYCQEYYCQEWCSQQPGPPINAVSITQSTSSSDRLLLALDAPVTGQICGVVDRFQDQWTSAGLFLHYSNNGPPVLDTQGEQLAPIAEHWVLPPQRDYAYERGYFPSMIPIIPIDCPF